MVAIPRVADDRRITPSSMLPRRAQDLLAASDPGPAQRTGAFKPDAPTQFQRTWSPQCQKIESPSVHDSAFWSRDFPAPRCC